MRSSSRFKGVSDRNAAEALRNVELFVPRERLPDIDEDDTCITPI